MNKNRCVRQVQQETTNRAPWLRRVAKTVLMVYLWQSILVALPAPTLAADGPVLPIAPASNAPAGQRPIMDAAANGVPLVHIAPPSGAGVSHNQYDQFNVNPNGLILNNSTGATQTQLGGWIGGNLQMGPTPARIILNEVVTANPSQLHGTIEIAGRRADIVIANPNGITCDGCGFLNTGRASLTTGTPRFGEGGSLTGFDVRQGQLTIGDRGLTATHLEQLDLMARGIVIEGEVWAKNLNAIAGANQVLYATLRATAQAGNGTAPRFAIDIKDVGGMYANQVYLVATEQGLGVNSQGRMAALQGNLTLSTNGDLTLKDSYAKQDIQLASRGNATLAGQTVSEGNTRITSGGSVNQSGIVDAQGQLAISALLLDNSGELVQRGTGTMDITTTGDASNSGTIYSAGRLDLRAARFTDTQGALLAADDLSVRAQAIQFNGTQVITDRNLDLDATSLGDIISFDTQLHTAGHLRATGRISNTASLWQAGQSLLLEGASVANQDGTILAGSELDIAVTGAVDNRGGSLLGGGNVTVAAGNLINDDHAQIISDQATRIMTTGIVSNQNSVISGKSGLALHTHGNALDNTGGVLVSDAGLSLDAGTLTNDQGRIISVGQDGTQARINAAAIINQQGMIDAANGLTLATPGSVDNLDGVIQAGAGALALHSGSFDNTGGKILARGGVSLTTGTLTNNANEAYIIPDISFDPSAIATIAAFQGAVSISAGQTNNRMGIISSATGTRIVSLELDNSAGQISSDTALTIDTQRQRLINDSGTLAASDTITLATGELSNFFGVIFANNRVAIDNTGAIVNRGQIVSDGQISLTSAALDNTMGMVNAKQDARITLGTGLLTNEEGWISGGRSLTLQSGEIRNKLGSLLSGSSLSLDTQGQSLDNSGGRIIANGDVALTASPLINNDGTVASLQGNLSINSNGQALDNQRGKLQAAGNTTIAAGDTANQAGLISGIDVTLATGNLDNTGGTVIAGGKLSADTQALDNDQGLLMSAGDTRIDTHGQRLTVTRSGSTGGIVAGGALHIQSGALHSASGYLASNGDQTLNIAADLNNGMLDGVTGQIVSNGGIAIDAANILNGGGTINALGNGGLHASQLIDNRGGLIDNRGGRIAVNGNLALDATMLDNSAANGSAGRIDATDVTINASTFANAGGTMRAAHDATLATATLDNTQGTISARRNLTVNATTLNNTLGTLVGDERVTVTTRSQAPAGTIASNDVTLNIQGDYLNTGLLSARKDLTINASSITNSGSLIANDTLTATTSGNLTNSGEISAHLTRLNIGGTLTNTANGLIDGTDTDISAGIISNTARIYSDDLRIAGDTLDNTGPGVVGARSLLLIGTRTINNTYGGLLFSLGDMVIGGGLDDKGNVTGWSTSLRNGSGRIEALGNLYIGATTLTNRNDNLSFITVIDPSQKEERIQARGSNTQYPALQCWLDGDYMNCKVYPDKYGQRSPLDPVRERIGFFGTEQINYTWDAPEFTRFGVTPVSAPPTSPAGGCSGFQANSAACRQWRSDYAAWDIGYQSALDQLEIKINAYNAEVNEDNRVNSFEDFYLYRLTATRTHNKLLNSNPAQIFSGGDMMISGGRVDNFDSQIVAGGNLYKLLDGGLNDVATLKMDRTDYSGTVEYTQVNSCGFFGGDHCRDWYGENRYDPAPLYADGHNAPLIGITVEENKNLTAPRPLAASILAPSNTEASTATTASANTRAATPQGIGATLDTNDYVPLSIQRVTAIGSDERARDVILTAPPRLSVPGSRLFVLHPEPEASYLIETDPRFTRQRDFVSSDYFFTRLNLDPERHLKRYGDGFYEQQLVNGQILALTSQRYLTGYRDSEQQYQALMEAGVAFARDYQLTPGVALTGEQMAILTTDIVWLTTRTVTLPDGSTTQVLVPQVYLRRPEGGDLRSDGALIAGENVYIQAQGNLNNSGAIAARGSATLIVGDDLVNQGGRISGQNVVARARNDLKNLSGLIDGLGNDSQITLQAGHDLVLQTNTLDTVNADGSSTRIAFDSMATVQGGNVHLDAGRDLRATGSTVTALNDLVATAGRNIALEALAGYYQIQSRDTSGHSVAGRSGFITEENTTHQLTTFTAGNSATLVAGNDTTLNGADLVAGSNILLQGANVNIASVTNRQSHDIQTVGNDNYHRIAQDTETLTGGNLIAGDSLTVRATGQSGVPDTGNLTVTGAYLTAGAGQASLLARNDITLQAATTAQRAVDESHDESGTLVQSVTTTQGADTAITQTTGSAVTGNTVFIQAGRDVTLIGSQAVADGGLAIDAGRDLTLTTVQQTLHTASAQRQTTDGIFANGGASLTLGTQQQRQNAQSTTTLQSGSTVGSLQSNVSLTAGKAYQQTGSTVIAPQGDIDIRAQTVNIVEAQNTGQATQETKFEQSGLTVALTSPVIEALQTGQQMASAAGQTSDLRLQALALATTGLAGYNAYNAVARNPAQAGGINVSISAGGSQSQSSSTQTNSTAQGSTVMAGGNITIQATGAGSESDLAIQGSRVTAGNNVSLKADDQINLLAARSTAEQHSSNKSSSASLGVSFGTDGLMATASASGGRGNADGGDAAWTNTHIDAGNTLTLESGGDTNIKGAVASGQQVAANVGGDLNIESLQDTSTYDSKQQSIGGSVSVGYGKASGSFSASQQKVNSDFASVTEQSGIKAGDGGFQIDVKGNTDLKGAVIASTDKAIEEGRNSLTTATLTQSDIQNKADARAESSGITLSSDMFTQGKYGASKAIIGNALNNSSESDSSSGKTLSAVSGGMVTITNDAAQQQRTGQTAEETIASLNRDTASAHSAAQKLDVQGMQRTVEAEQAIKQATFKEITTISDAIYRSETADKKIILQKCDSQGDCQRRQVDAKDVKVGPDGKVYVFNHGIMNSEEEALRNAYQQSTSQANAQGVYVIINPHTGSAIAEVIYAGWDKFFGPILGISNAAEANIDIANEVRDQGGTLDVTGHSRRFSR
ncbi:MAG: hemagglutinin repeat-containing protein [Gammaproteobacteria bacterium]|nr:hemagglutinin repeat-containing protein [Gammaproteobacteria bacterium]